MVQLFNIQILKRCKVMMQGATLDTLDIFSGVAGK